MILGFRRVVEEGSELLEGSSKQVRTWGDWCPRTGATEGVDNVAESGADFVIGGAGWKANGSGEPGDGVTDSGGMCVLDPDAVASI